MKSIKGGRCNKDSSVVRDLNPHVIFELIPVLLAVMILLFDKKSKRRCWKKVL